MNKIKIPFCVIPPAFLQKYSRPFLGIAQRIERKMLFLQVSLSQAEVNVSSTQYLSMCLVSNLIMFFVLFIFGLGFTKIGIPWWGAIIFAVVISGFVYLQQMAYPTLVASRRIKAVEQNLLPALQDMLIQLNSGVPLFNILVNVANGDYGKVSKEFELAVKEINAGRSQIDVLEEIAVRNPSVLFRRAIWQLVNGMKEGANISTLLKEVVQSISDEQITQVQKYGGQLSPLALFYMLIAIIAPSLGTTFIIILSSFVNLSPLATKFVFFGLLTLTVFFQIMFLGMIKTRRPALLTTG